MGNRGYDTEIFEFLESFLDVLCSVFGTKVNSFRAAANVEVSSFMLFNAPPFEVDGLGAPLAADKADRLPLDGLHLGVDACSCSITQCRADDVTEVQQELVFTLEAIGFDPNDRSVVCHTDQEIPTVGV